MKSALRLISRFFIAVAILIAPFPLFFTDILGPTVVLLVCFGWIVLLAELAQRWAEPPQGLNFAGRRKADETRGAQRQRQRGPEAPTAKPSSKRTWRTVLGFQEDENPRMGRVRSAYRRLAKSGHPDAGGTHAQMLKLNAALDEARRELQKKRART